MGKKKKKRIIPSKDQIAMDLEKEGTHFNPEAGEVNYPQITEEERKGNEAGREALPRILDVDKGNEVEEVNYPQITEEERKGNEVSTSNILERTIKEVEERLAYLEQLRQRRIKLVKQKEESDRSLAEVDAEILKVASEVGGLGHGRKL